MHAHHIFLKTMHTFTVGCYKINASYLFLGFTIASKIFKDWHVMLCRIRLHYFFEGKNFAVQQGSTKTTKLLEKFPAIQYFLTQAIEMIPMVDT